MTYFEENSNWLALRQQELATKHREVAAFLTALKFRHWRAQDRHKIAVTELNQHPRPANHVMLRDIRRDTSHALCVLVPTLHRAQHLQGALAKGIPMANKMALHEFLLAAAAGSSVEGLTFEKAPPCYRWAEPSRRIALSLLSEAPELFGELPSWAASLLKREHLPTLLTLHRNQAMSQRQVKVAALKARIVDEMQLSVEEVKLLWSL